MKHRKTGLFISGGWLIFSWLRAKEKVEDKMRNGGNYLFATDI
ncbi:hypothetical protein [Aneurinibacillus migulanus]|uniref:Uncharacterized protein n=1 Tax=Aneurinibacillus migulanus TaxID=47500 RepID=A0A1G8ILS8_ANEMI|nr:hypothetical protein [Aneurinibacillus migulanus]MED0892413.1 hypothetical protein [Aneurinibacillus migulanus]MED1615634.1 hypothetical protein [Aneurinibacillus migulanus]GED12520.1 hypothetical protein AMI01nite_05110 [Aneurinibacillus migulanus]SDI19843.1 hypothetical protein SAMN04487909_10284 [Aneurinibacillus migulanus]